MSENVAAEKVRSEAATGVEAATEASPRSAARPKRRGKGLAWLAIALIAFGLAWDLARPPSDQVTTRVLLAGIDFYQLALSPVGVRMGIRCRFEPTCSHYAEAVIARDGALVGGGRAAFRILRCGPWTPRGTLDPP